MQWAVNIAFFMYLLLLARADLKTKSLPPTLLIGGGLLGFLLLGLRLLAGELGAERLLPEYGPGLLLGIILWGLSRVSGGALGKGDSLAFISFSFWKPWGFCFSLLMFSSLFLALSGILLMLKKGQKKDLKLPLMPFVAAWALVLILGELLPAASP